MTVKNSDPGLDDPVTVPRWVLDQLIPMSLGAMKLLKAMKDAGHPSAVSDEEMQRGEEAIVIAFEAIHGKDDGASA